MDSRNRCLDVIRRHLGALGALLELCEAERDKPAVPEASILFFEQHQLACTVDARWQTCGLERHEGDERVGRGRGDG